MIFEINKSYNFNTLASTVLGASYNNMKVKGVLTADETVKYREIYTLHTTLQSVILALPANPQDCTYILFETTQGDKVVLAQEYIDLLTVVAVTTINIRVDVIDVTTDDIPIIRNRLLELGYTNVNITTV